MDKKKKANIDSTIFISRKQKKEEWKRFSFRSVNDGIDCGDKQCFLEYRVIPDCEIALETNNTQCTIPCLMTGCETELHHFIACPIWSCEPFTTSTKSTTSTTFSTTTTNTKTTSSTTTQRPKPNPYPPNNMSALIYTSIVINIVFFAILSAFIVVKLRSRISSFLARRREPGNDLNPNRYFSLGDSSDNETETDPLIPPRSNQQGHGSIDTESNLTIVNRNANINLPSIMEGIDNIAHNISNERADSTAGPSTADGTAGPSVSGLATNWQDVNLQSASLPGDISADANATLLNESQTETEPKNPIFLLMKTFRKK